MYGIPYLQTEGHRHADPGALKDMDGNVPAARGSWSKHRNPAALEGRRGKETRGAPMQARHAAAKGCPGQPQRRRTSPMTQRVQEARENPGAHATILLT